MKTKLVRPVSIESKERTDFILVGTDNHLYNWRKFGYPMKVKEGRDTYQQLILISLDPDEKIEKGDKYYSVIHQQIFECISNDQYFENEFKVIATQSQLSPEYIQQFIEEYNKGEVKDVEIEMERLYSYEAADEFDEVGFCGFRPKLTNGFVTVVVEKERGITITRVDEETKYPYNLLCNMQYYMEYCQENEYVTPQEWLNKFKHYTDRKEPILYTEEEVKELLLRFAEECDSNEDLICYDGHINGVRQYNDLKKWFNQNKKK